MSVIMFVVTLGAILLQRFLQRAAITAGIHGLEYNADGADLIPVKAREVREERHRERPSGRPGWDTSMARKAIRLTIVLG